MKHALKAIAASPVVIALALLTQTAHAAGVDAGTLINNTATATYTSGASGGSVQSNTVTVKVDELLDVAVAGLASAPVAIGAGTAVLPFSITNTGNGAEAYNLSTNPTVAGNQFNAVVQSVVIDSNGNGTYDPGVDTVLPAGTATPALTPDETLKVFVIVTVPAGATDAQTSQLALTATAVTGSGTPGTVVASAGQGGGDAVVGASGATASAKDPMIASAATVSLAKSAVIADPFGGSSPVPGAVVTYTIVATVAGSGSADGLHITDVIPTGTSYQSGTLKLDGSALTDGADVDAGTASSSGVDVSLGSVAGGSTKTVKFDVKIN
jgi:uncharacterized repeat protein (TIGR01451 family)